MSSTITDRASGLGTGATPNGENATISQKVPCRVATTANITLAGLQTLDTVTVVADDRVLVKDQTDASENGIYLASADAWQRTNDAVDDGDLVKGSQVRVNEGAVGAGSYYVTSDDPIDIGTDDIAWVDVASTVLTGAEIKALYEAEADTNAYDDAAVSKLVGIEASADVTDTANVTAAGALMDSELTNITAVKALNQGVATTDTPTFTGIQVNNADTTLDRHSAGNIRVEGNLIYRAGGTDIPVADGGTGASTASGARTNLGVAIGSDVQAFDAFLDDIADLTDPGADRLLMWDDSAGIVTWAELNSEGLEFDGTTLQSVRRVLTANETIYIRTDGNDSNDGSANDSSNAKLTLQGAFNEIVTWDFNGFIVTVKFASGTYNAGTVNVPVCTGQAGAAYLIIEGDTTTPANVVLNNNASASNAYINTPPGTACTIQGLRFTGGTSNARGCGSSGGELVFGTSGTLDFGAFTGTSSAHIFATDGGQIKLLNRDYEVDGDVGRHIFCQQNGTITSFGGTVTMTGTPDWLQYGLYATRGGIIQLQHTYSGAATGQRYLVEKVGWIETFGAGVNYFPGDVAGSGANYS